VIDWVVARVWEETEIAARETQRILGDEPSGARIIIAGRRVIQDRIEVVLHPGKEIREGAAARSADHRMAEGLIGVLRREIPIRITIPIVEPIRS
jgi:hypothetical protein